MDDEDHDSPQSAHVRSRTWIPESPWEAPEDLSGGHTASYAASTGGEPHMVGENIVENLAWTPKSPWETPEGISGGRMMAFHAAPADREFHNLSTCLTVLAGSEACTDFIGTVESGARELAFMSIPGLCFTDDDRTGEEYGEGSPRSIPIMGLKLGHQPETKAFSN